jgi:hypothetical protein
MSSWFTKLFGFKEATGNMSAMARTKACFEFDRASGRLKSKENGTVFDAGLFELPSLQQLREGVNLGEAREKFPGRVKVSELVASVCTLHRDPQNQLALFQAASQFNCLEFASMGGRPEHGINVTKMITLRGQRVQLHVLRVQLFEITLLSTMGKGSRAPDKSKISRMLKTF